MGAESLSSVPLPYSGLSQLNPFAEPGKAGLMTKTIFHVKKQAQRWAPSSNPRTPGGEQLPRTAGGRRDRGAVGASLRGSEMMGNLRVTPTHFPLPSLPRFGPAWLTLLPGPPLCAGAETTASCRSQRETRAGPTERPTLSPLGAP